LRGGQDFAVAHEARRGVVVVGGDAEDVHASSARARLSNRACGFKARGAAARAGGRLRRRFAGVGLCLFCGGAAT
jgi:hypothetical protein